MFLFDLLKALGVRLMLLTHSLLIVLLASQTSTRWEFWLLCLTYLCMVVEAIVTVCVNKAQEWKWICPCFLCYLLCTVPAIWILELDHQQQYLQGKNNIPIEHNNSTDVLNGLNALTGVQVDKNTLVAVEEQLFLYLMILSRWILPRGKITRDALSQLLFVFIGIASDITELFTLFEEDKVKQSTTMTYIVLVIWTVSLLQFTLVLTTTNSPKKPRAMSTVGSDPDREENSDTGDNSIKGDNSQNCFQVFFQSEIWSITVNFFLQDGPFLAIRLYIMIYLNVLTYSIIFFTAKNGLVVMMLFYRISVVCCEYGKRKKKTNVVASDKSNDAYQSNEGSTDRSVRSRSTKEEHSN